MPIIRPVYPNELYHYGVKGMHWGIRRYQPYPKGYSGKGRYLGRIQGGAKVDKLTSKEKLRRRRRRRGIALATGLTAAGLAGIGAGVYFSKKWGNRGDIAGRKSVGKALVADAHKINAMDLAKNAEEHLNSGSAKILKGSLEGNRALTNLGNLEVSAADSIANQAKTQAKAFARKAHQSDRYLKTMKKYYKAGRRAIWAVPASTVVLSTGVNLGKNLYNNRKKKKRRVRR